MTGDPAQYADPTLAPFRCHSAVVDPLGNTVILRQGRSGGFGMLHALLDHNVSDEVIERVVSSAYPLTAPSRRIRYIAEFRREGNGIMQVRVSVDPNSSNETPDPELFGVVTAFCKLPQNADFENKCPDWVDHSF